MQALMMVTTQSYMPSSRLTPALILFLHLLFGAGVVCDLSDNMTVDFINQYRMLHASFDDGHHTVIHAIIPTRTSLNSKGIVAHNLHQCCELKKQNCLSIYDAHVKFSHCLQYRYIIMVSSRLTSALTLRG